MSAKNKSFRLPCLYCNDEVTFDNSQQLKEHLLKKHEELVSSHGSQIDNNNNNKNRNLDRRRNRASSLSLLQRTENGLTAPYSTSSFSPSLPSTGGYGDSSQALSTHGTSGRTIPSDESFKNIKTISTDDLIHQFRKISEDKIFKDNQILQERLTAIGRHNKEDELDPEEKAELQDGEDAVPEVETETPVDTNDFVSDHETVLSRIGSLSADLDDGSAVKSFEQQRIRENEKNMSLKKQLENERIENESLKAEKETLSGRSKEDRLISSLEKEHQKKIKLLEEKYQNTLQHLPVPDGANKDHEDKKKMRLLEKKYQHTHMQLNLANGVIEDLNKKIENLHAEKGKLVERLKSADQSLQDLSNRQIASPRSVQFEGMSPPSKGTMGFIMNHMGKQLKVSLEQISNTVQQVSSREMSSRKELIDLKDELHRVTLSLAEEKLKHDQIKRLHAEMEETISVMSENENQKSKICEDLNALRNKHKKCYLNENTLKQTKREKKALQKKYENLRRKFDLLNILHGTLKEELITADISRKQELSVDFLSNVRSDEIDSETVDKLRQDVSERDQVIEEYEISQRNLKEEMELTSNELEETKLVNNNLEKNQDMHMKTLNERIKQMSVCITDMQSDKNRKCEDLEQTNGKYKSDLGNLEKHLIERENKIKSLRENINQLESTKLENESKIAMLNEENESLRFSERTQGKDDDNESPIIEHLKLEKDILSSRVLILEGIVEETEIMKKEKDQLREINEDLRSQLLSKRSEFKVKGSLSDGDIHKGTVRYTTMKESKSTNSDYEAIKELENDDDDYDDNDLVKNARRLSDMNESDKQRLQMLLTDPVFEQLLSNTDLVDLKGFDMDLTNREESGDELNLVSETNRNGTLAGLHEALEYVQTIHLPDDESEVTIQYVKESSDENHEVEGNGNEDAPVVLQDKRDSDNTTTSTSKKKKFLGKIRNRKKVKKEKRKGTPEPMYDKLNELVNEKNSDSNVKQSPSNNKHVQFSDEPKELMENGTNRENDVALFKSYYQECLKNEYPVLAENNEDDLESANSSYTAESVSPLNVVSNEKVFLAAKTTTHQSDESIQSETIGTGFDESISDTDQTAGRMSCESDESYQSTTTNESKSDVSDLSGEKDSPSDINEWYESSSKKNKSSGAENLERYMRLSMVSDHGYGSKSASRGSMSGTASISSDIHQSLSFSAVYSEENAEIAEANLRQNKDRFTSKKEFEDFMKKYKQARAEFSEKKKDASDALKVLKTFMSKADDLKEKPTNMNKNTGTSNFLDMVRGMNSKGKSKSEKSKVKGSAPKSEPPDIGISTEDDVTSTPIQPKAHRFLPVDLRKQRLSLS